MYLTDQKASNTIQIVRTRGLDTVSIVDIKQLTRDYGQGRGIFDLSLSIEEGEVFGFLGPNGAGKTTTIRHLMGFIKSQVGSCTIRGMDCWKDRTKIQEDLGYIPGEMAFFDDSNGKDFLDFINRYRHSGGSTADAQVRAKELLERFECDPRAKLKKMSKGTRQKVGIVAAFMHDPSVYILDEPTSGLDPLMQLRFIDLLLEEKKRGKTILLSSHMFEEVERTCHRLAIIKEGHIVAEDLVDRLKVAQTKRFVISLKDDLEATRLKEHLEQAGITVESLQDTELTCFIATELNLLIRILQAFDVLNIYTPKQSLEDIFIDFYGDVKHGGDR